MNGASEQDMQYVDTAIQMLSEHFDSVHIFVTRHEGQKGTIALNRGTGNVAAQMGQIKEFILISEERTRCTVRKAMTEPE